jgi:LytS/YehU family sensor histidine kinase
MNTLTAVSQAMVENPPSAAQLIDDLAEELRELGLLAEHKEVPLGRELELCRTHLRVMSARTEKPWRLEIEQTDLAAKVPPALFFTLIENSFTHQQPITGSTAFRLRAERAEQGVRYVFFAPGKVRVLPDRPSGGGGLRYVKARLNECWPGGWNFRHGPVAGGWETVVELALRQGGTAR